MTSNPHRDALLALLGLRMDSTDLAIFNEVKRQRLVQSEEHRIADKMAEAPGALTRDMARAVLRDQDEEAAKQKLAIGLGLPPNAHQAQIEAAQAKARAAQATAS